MATVQETTLRLERVSASPAPGYHFHVDRPVSEDRVDRVLTAFAAILRFSGYGPLLDSYAAALGNCGRCAVTCPIYRVTEDPRDAPCYRSHLLLDVYKRHLTLGG